MMMLLSYMCFVVQNEMMQGSMAHLDDLGMEMIASVANGNYERGKKQNDNKK